MKDTIKEITGTVKVEHFDGNMNLIKIHEFKNLVVTTGKEWIAGRLNNPVPPIMNYIALGTGTTAPVLTDTTLETEIYRQVVTTPGGAVSGNSLVFTQTVGAGSGTGALTEAGIFDLAAAGTMLSRVTYPVINKGASDTIAITWTIVIGA